MPQSEALLLRESGGDRALAIVIVENEDDYRRADEILSAVPADEAAGRRTSVTKYEIAARATERQLPTPRGRDPVPSRRR